MLLIFKLFFIASILNIYKSEANDTIKDYISEKWQETEDIYATIYSENLEDSEDTGKWIKLWSEISEVSDPLVITIFGQLFVFEDQQLNPVSVNPNGVRLEMNLTYLEGPIKFMKNFEWNEYECLLICQASSCLLYRGTEPTDIKYWNEFAYDNLSANDAIFFIYRNLLHLLIYYNINDNSTNKTKIKIYQLEGYDWNEKFHFQFPYFIEDVASFNSNESTILLFVHDDESNRKTNCYVYEFTDSLPEFITKVDLVTSVHIYNYKAENFILLINDENSSGIYKWNGSDLRRIITIPELKSSSLVNIVNVDNITLLFACNANETRAYKIITNNYYHLEEFNLPSDQKVVQIEAWKNENLLRIVQIKYNLEDTYQIDLWQTYFDQSETEIDSSEVLECLVELRNSLKMRIPAVETLKTSWPKFPALQNISNTSPLQLQNVFVDGGYISSLEFHNQEDMRIFSPLDTNNELIELEEKINVIFNKSKNIVTDDKVVSLSGNLVIYEDAHFQDFTVDYLNIEYLNNQSVEFENIFIPGVDQNFSIPLRARNLYFQNLEVSSICGLDFDLWLQTDDIVRTKFLSIIGSSSSSIQDDTISIKTDISLKQLNSECINGVNITNFFEDAFILGKNQIIEGNLTYNGVMRATKITTKEINNVPSTAILTKNTNQTLDDVFIDTLQAKHLFVDKINGVPVNEAAKMSQENVIKGKVTIAKLIITDELVVAKENVALPLTHPTQLYEDIIIDGNIFVKNLEFDDESDLTVDATTISLFDIQNIVRNSWRKSRNQTIENPIIFEKGASIDELTSEYINGCNKQDFFYVDSYTMNDLNKVTFANFQFHKIVNEESGLAEHFLNDTSDKLIFYKTIHINQLSADRIFTENYNGIPIDDIMQANSSFKFLGTTEFEAVHVVDQMLVNDLHMNQLNLKEITAFEKALRSNENFEVNELNVSSVNVKNLFVEKLCNADLEKALEIFENLKNSPNNFSLTIDGDVEIEGEIQVDKINENDTNDYLDIFSTNNINDLTETGNIQNIHIVENLNIYFLNGQNIDDIFAIALSKTNKQSLEDVSVFNSDISFLTTNKINDMNISNLMFVDEPCILYGNTSFSKLVVEGNITTTTLNNQNIEEIQNKLQVIPKMNTLNSLYIFGNMFWDSPSLNMNSLNNLLSKAVTKHENQLINHSVSFQGPLIIDSLYLDEEDSFVLQKTYDIVSDAFIDKANSEELIKGTKIFKEKLSVSDLEVVNNIDIETINNINIGGISSQIFRKFNNDSVLAQITFFGQVEIGALITDNNIHGIHLQELAIMDKKMPKNLHFDHLIVEGNVSVYQLDDVVFDEFRKKRVSIHEDVEIFVDVEFHRPVTVLNKTYVSFINGIRPTNLVVDIANHAPNIISGKKVFASELTVEGDIETSKINSYNLSTMFENSIFNDETLEIFGNLIFEVDVETSGNINVFGTVNGLKPQSIIQIQGSQEKWTVGALNREELLIKNLITSSSNISGTLAQCLLYLEVDNELSFHLTGAQNLRSIQVDSLTRLDIYAAEDGGFCSLQSSCYCKRQHVVEISSSDSLLIYPHDSANITFNFYDPHRLLAVQLISDAVSTSKYCFKNTSEEIATIVWKKFGEINIKEKQINPGGYISDAQIFVNNDRLYLILAIFYNKTMESYALESILYEINLQNDQVNPVQLIPTDGAKTVHVFQTSNGEIYALIGCVKGKSESLLLRFDETTRQFQFIRIFATGGSKHVASIIRDNKSFVILNNPDIEALQIFIYDPVSDNFIDYQNLYFESRVTSLNVFYIGDVGRSEAFIVTTTKDGWLFMYEYMFFGKFQLKLSYWVEDVQIVSPFRHMNQSYLFVGAKSSSTVYKVIQQ